MNMLLLRRWLSIAFIACSSLASVANASGSLNSAATEVLTAETGSAEPESFVPKFLNVPPPFSGEQSKQQEKFLNRNRGAGAFHGTPANIDANAAPQPGTETNINSVNPLAPNSFSIFRNQALSPGLVSDVNEPSHANAGKNIWYTGNWYAARSINNGGTWTYVDPYADFPDFCCDQDVIHDPGRELLIWYRQGVQLVGGNNNIKIGVSKNGGTTFKQYTLTYTNWGGLPLGWFDYPQLAVSNNYLWITSNYFNPNGTFQRMILTKISLDQLQAGGALTWNYWSRTTGWTWAPTQGAKDIMYIGDHTNQSTFNICTQPESNAVLSCFDIAVPAWTATNRGSAVCTTPNGLNPCARLDQRVNVGWLKESETSNGHVLGFFWTVAQGAGFLFPYVNAIAVDAQTLVPLPGGQGRPFIWNGSGAFVYGGAAPNKRGGLGISTWFIGGGNYPILYAGIDDDYNGQPPGWEIAFVAGSNGVNGNRWGDYTRVRSFSPTVGVWSLSGHITNNGIQVPYYANFGRDRDKANWTRFRTK